jgi:ArsR family transcriptional regulator
MKPRARPEGCCEKPAAAAPLAKKTRNDLVAVFRALADPTRLEIFRLIAAQSAPLCACDIVSRFHLRQPTISHHLKVLRDAGLVNAERRGIWSHYEVRPEGMALLRRAPEALVPEESCAKC